MAISSDVKLSIYNDALRILGSRRIASLAEDREPRRVLDDAWGSAGDGVRYVLEMADWNFATRAVEAAYEAGIEPDFGFRRAFLKPDDIIRVTSIAVDEFFRRPLTSLEYGDEAGYWLAEHDTLYIRYVSDDDSWGFDSGKWPMSFRKLLSGYLAYEACERLTNSTQKMAAADRVMQDALKHAKSRDAMDEGVKFAPAGSWVTSRGGWRRDKARGSLIG